jgi:hypothetical protein
MRRRASSGAAKKRAAPHDIVVAAGVGDATGWRPHQFPPTRPPADSYFISEHCYDPATTLLVVCTISAASPYISCDCIFSFLCCCSVLPGSSQFTCGVVHNVHWGLTFTRNCGNKLYLWFCIWYSFPIVHSMILFSCVLLIKPMVPGLNHANWGYHWFILAYIKIEISGLKKDFLFHNIGANIFFCREIPNALLFTGK